jgi:hypothetical protein
LRPLSIYFLCLYCAIRIPSLASCRRLWRSSTIISAVSDDEGIESGGMALGMPRRGRASRSSSGEKPVDSCDVAVILELENRQIVGPNLVYFLVSANETSEHSLGSLVGSFGLSVGGWMVCGGKAKLHRPGRFNTNVDTLTRFPIPTISPAFHVSLLQVDKEWENKLWQQYKEDPYFRRILTDVQILQKKT